MTTKNISSYVTFRGKIRWCDLMAFNRCYFDDTYFHYYIIPHSQNINVLGNAQKKKFFFVSSKFSYHNGYNQKGKLMNSTKYTNASLFGIFLNHFVYI